MLTRREFIATPVAGALVAATVPAHPLLPGVISTWEFGRAANQEAWKVLVEGGPAIDAVERGVNQAELDPNNLSVGFGGLPDEEGEVTQDAILFWGPPHAVGAVGAIKRIKRPISVARQVMEKTRHTLLVGEDATRFALRNGWKEETLLTPRARLLWESWKRDPTRNDYWNHDTIGMAAMDRNGDLCAGTSTSGLAFKIKGRVGDVSIPGAGAYVDNEVGAVAATGDGDVMMRFAPSIVAVELMRQGAPPAEACSRSLTRILDKGYRVQACLVAINKKGEFGAARIGDRAFPHAVRNSERDEVRII